ncbi:MAG TPA: tryptophan synthase subunit alpha [Candidatus Dormibacteraeota bacterium]
MATARAESALAAAVRADGDVKLIPYLMAGYPDRDRSIELGRMYARCGAAAIEVGIPFSDPLADGPVIQRVGKAALDGGMTTAGALAVAGTVAEVGVPVVLMTYVNPLLAYDARRFAADAARAGVRGVILVDLPPEEAGPILDWLRAAGLDTVFLVAPTSPDPRIEMCAAASTGFIYCVSVTGVTGVRDDLDPRVEHLLVRVRRLTDLPLAVGFGISRPEHVRALRGQADAAVVASALMNEVQEGRDPQPLFERLVNAWR